METKITESTPSRSKMLYQHVARKVSWLQELLMADASSGKATAAMLRKNIGKAPGADPTVGDATLGDRPVGLQGWEFCRECYTFGADALCCASTISGKANACCWTGPG